MAKSETCSNFQEILATVPTLDLLVAINRRTLGLAARPFLRRRDRQDIKDIWLHVAATEIMLCNYPDLKSSRLSKLPHVLQGLRRSGQEII